MKNNKQQLIIICLSFFLVVACAQPLRTIFNTALTGGTYVLLKMQKLVTTPFTKILEYVHGDDNQKYQEIKNKYEQLLEEFVQYKAATNFYQNTAELTEFKNRYEQSGALLTQIIEKQQSALHHEFLVDLGSRHGITSGMIAVYKNCLVGKVTEVYPWFSKIVTINDRTCKVAIKCSNTNTEGIYQGTNTLCAGELIHISHLKPVEIGDLVLSSGQGLLFPYGFALGTIATQEVVGVNHHITIKHVIDWNELRYCYILQKNAAFVTS